MLQDKSDATFVQFLLTVMAPSVHAARVMAVQL
jgi:hypothetical protein